MTLGPVEQGRVVSIMSDMTTNSFEELDRDECLALLAATDLGRLAVIVGEYPEIFPVNYVLDGETITIRTSPGSKIDAALHSNVCFEVDYLSTDRGTAWSVVVIGSVSREGFPVDEIDHIDTLPDRSVIPGPKPALIRLNAHRITGRRYIRADLAPFDPHGYL